MKAVKTLFCGMLVGLAVYAIIYIPAPTGGLCAALLAGGGIVGFINNVKSL